MKTVTEQISISAKNYANALIEVVRDKKSTFDEISKDFENVREILNMSPELREILNNPTISLQAQTDIAIDVFKNEVSSTMLDFIKIVIDKKRFKEFSQIYRAYLEKLNEISNIQPVKVTSAIELSEDKKLQVIKKLEEKLNKTVKPEWELDDDIIAGLVIRIGDNVIDMSLKNKLAKMKKDLILK